MVAKRTFSKAVQCCVQNNESLGSQERRKVRCGSATGRKPTSDRRSDGDQHNGTEEHQWIDGVSIKQKGTEQPVGPKAENQAEGRARHDGPEAIAKNLEGENARLKKLGVKRATVCGIETDACVLGVMFTLFDAGIDCRVKPDLCWSSTGLHKQALKIIAMQFPPARR